MASITVRIPDEMKRDIDELKIEVSEVTRRALEEEVKRRKRENARRAAGQLGALLKKVPGEEIVKVIRESRETR